MTSNTQISVASFGTGVLRKFVIPEIVFGLGAIQLVGRYTRNFMGRRAFVVSDPGVEKAGWLNLALTSLEEAGIKYDVFTGVTPNPKASEVAEGARKYQQCDCDIIVAIGGGSPMDCAKGIGVSVANKMDVLTLAGVDQICLPGPPLICVPTTAGSSSDVSQFAIITDDVNHTKGLLASKVLVPDVTLIDPQTTFTMSESLTAHTGLDAFVHAVEAYVSTANSALTDLHALEAIKIITRYLPEAIVHRHNPEIKCKIMLASLQAGLAFSNASLGLVHAMSHSVSSWSDMPHGEINAILLEAVIELNYPHASDRYDRIAREMGVDIFGIGPDQRLEALLNAVRELVKKCGVSLSPSAPRPGPSDLNHLVELTLSDACIVTNPCLPTWHEVEVIYERTFR
jgi:alcohol dehydrogenase class IV